MNPLQQQPGRFRLKSGLLAVPFLVLVVVLVLVAAGIGLDQAADGVAAQKQAVRTTRASSDTPGGAASRVIGNNVDSYADVVSEVSPGVVTIRSERRVRQGRQFPFQDDPLFREFFGDRFRNAPPPPERREGGLGSGVIVREDGHVLTNHHVVDGAESIRVELRDGRSFDAKVVGSDPPSDLAVLKIEGSGLPALPLGNSDDVRVGDVVLAVGNPLGVGQTVTMGIVSAKGRATGLGDGSFEDFLQTDAPINRGNSGGALVNTRGELIGINSQILSPSGGNIGIGFSVPANMAGNVMEQLIASGRVQRGMLGVTVQSITSDLARSLGLDSVRGALVSDVQAGGPADKAGIERGDVVTAIDGDTVADSNALRNKVAALRPGTTASLTVVRDGGEQALSVTLGELPAGEAVEAGARGSGEPRLGLSLQPVTPELAGRLRLDKPAGLLVREVDASGPAAAAGFRSGDVILQVDGVEVNSVETLRKQLAQTPERPALMLVQREGRSLFLTLDMGERQKPK